MMVIGTFALNGTAAVASTTPCSTTTVILGGPAGSNTNCDVAVTTGPLGQSGELSFTADSAIVQTVPIAVGLNNFTFGVTVTDTRGTEQGWELQATSAGLSTAANPTVFLPLSITPSTSTCTPTADGPAGSNCPAPTFTPITLNTKPATFVTETPTGGNIFLPLPPFVATPISGTDVLSISGSYNVPIGTFPGAYTAAITLSLLDTAPSSPFPFIHHK